MSILYRPQPGSWEGDRYGHRGEIHSIVSFMVSCQGASALIGPETPECPHFRVRTKENNGLFSGVAFVHRSSGHP